MGRFKRGDISRLEFQKMRVCCPYCFARTANCVEPGEIHLGCDGTGIVCPRCKGARWLGQQFTGEASARRACPSCTFAHTITKNGEDRIVDEYDGDREMVAIEQYLDAYFAGLVSQDEEADRRAEIAAQRAEYEAAHPPKRGPWKADWLGIPAPRQSKPSQDRPEARSYEPEAVVTTVAERAADDIEF